MKRLVCTLLLASLAITPSSRAASPGKPQPPKFHPGVVVRDHFISISREGHLVNCQLRQGSQRDYGDLGTKLGPHVGVRDNKACVASQDQVYVVDLASGKIVYRAKHTVGIVKVGFLDEQRIYTLNHEAVEVFDLSDAQPPRKITLQPDKTAKSNDDSWRGFGAFPWSEKRGVPCCRSGSLLYVALPTQVDKGARRGGYSTLSDVAVIDLVKGKLLDRVKLQSGIIDIHVIRDRDGDDEMLCVCSGSFSYGMLMERFWAIPAKGGKIDLTSKQTRSASLPMDKPGTMSQSKFLGPRGELYTACGEAVRRFDSAGRQVAVAKGKLPTGGELVGVWARSVLIADAKGIHTVELSPIESADKKPKPMTR